VFYRRDNIVHCDVEKYTTDDVSALFVRFASGAMATFSSTNAAVAERWDMEYEVVFERFTMRCASLDSARCWVTDPDAPDEFIVEPGAGPYRVETEDFLAAIRENRPTRCPVSEGLTALRVIEAAEESAKRGVPVELATV
jgi:predicted dehydrogenase